jgi:hypothetical protein
MLQVFSVEQVADARMLNPKPGASAQRKTNGMVPTFPAPFHDRIAGEQPQRRCWAQHDCNSSLIQKLGGQAVGLLFMGGVWCARVRERVRMLRAAVEAWRERREGCRCGA